jgi:hypothetical protein
MVHSELQRQNPNKAHTPAEIQKTMNEMLAPQKTEVDRSWFGTAFLGGTVAGQLYNAVTGGNAFKTSTEQPRWKVEFESQKASNARLGDFSAKMGKDVVQKMGATPREVENFMAQVDPMNGPSLFLPRQPGHRAIQFLMKQGKKVTPETVKAVLEYTDGTGIVEDTP